jgi:UDP:flavonoid glycosyltransferase YjiC (YdhE family)
MTVQPGVGHLHPMAPLARSLAVDHEVLVASSAGFLPRIERFGLRAIPIGVDWTQATATQTLPGFVESDGFGQLRLYASRLAGPAASDLLEVASTWRPDLILRDATDFGAWVAGEKLNIPTAAFGMMIRTVGPLLVHAAGPELAAVRQDFGLPPDPELASFGGALYIDAVPPFFTPADWPAPQSLMHVRPPLLDRSDDAVAPSWVDDLGSPLVLMTLGTVFNDARLVQLAVDACVSLDVDLVVTLGETGDPGAFGSLPPRVRVERYVPHSLVLPRCSAVISHAGFNATMAALDHGLPTVAMPASADQPFNAWRLAELGLGINLGSPKSELFPVVDSDELTAARVGDAVERAVFDPAAREAPLQAKRALRDLPSVEAVAARLVGLAETA